uniref:Uncharacterized protein n=1 Tax=Rhizophora mucronata TaxID=61149 RepID=A0A2P2R1L5_RHIMU
MAQRVLSNNLDHHYYHYFFIDHPLILQCLLAKAIILDCDSLFSNDSTVALQWSISWDSRSS